MRAPVMVILNPASSGGKAGRLATTVERTLTEMGVGFELRTTRAPGHAEDLAREAAADRRETVVAVGGDGTVHEVAQGLLETFLADRTDEDSAARTDPPALAVVPVGTGNDFFRMVGVDRDPAVALSVLRDGRPVRFDVGTASWEDGRRHFVNLLGIGVDVEVLRRRSAFGRLPGISQYLAALLVAVVRFRPIPVRILLEGHEPITDRAHLGAVTVGPSAGGGFLLNPGAIPDDGKLDLCFVEALTLPQIARLIPRVIRGTHGDLDVVRLRRFERGSIERLDGGAFHFQLDGELMPEPVSRLEVEVRPACLPVLVPGAAETGAGRSSLEQARSGGTEVP